MNEQAQQRQLAERKKHWETLWWAGAFLWAGVVLLIDAAEMLPAVGEADAWSWIFAGAGVLALVGNFWRVVSPDEPNPTWWDHLWSGILLILGFAGFLSVEVAFPLILLLVGGVLLVRALAPGSKASDRPSNG